MNLEQLIDLSLTACAAFFDKEHILLEVDANERSLTHKLAEQLQLVFPDWDVDCEYNRIVDGVKRLPKPEHVETNDTQGRTIFPDIIVHRRAKVIAHLVGWNATLTDRSAGRGLPDLGDWRDECAHAQSVIASFS